MKQSWACFFYAVLQKSVISSRRARSNSILLHQCSREPVHPNPASIVFRHSLGCSCVKYRKVIRHAGTRLTLEVGWPPSSFVWAGVFLGLCLRCGCVPDSVSHNVSLQWFEKVNSTTKSQTCCVICNSKRCFFAILLGS